LNNALFDGGKIELKAANIFNDLGLDWDDESNLDKKREYEENEGWWWDGEGNVSGVSWGGCLESIDEMLRNGVDIPGRESFDDMVLFMETSEEIPSAEYVKRVIRALGEKDLLTRVKAVLMGRPQARSFNEPNFPEKRKEYRSKQREAVVKMVRSYNKKAVIVQNLDIGHTNPQIPLPVGREIEIRASEKKIIADF
jgi:muramoyltetrapeptide carboxypeptidase LdcA involved in peptidoglycan recycling